MKQGANSQVRVKKGEMSGGGNNARKGGVKKRKLDRGRPEGGKILMEREANQQSTQKNENQAFQKALQGCLS